MAFSKDHLVFTRGICRIVRNDWYIRSATEGGNYLNLCSPSGLTGSMMVSFWGHVDRDDPFHI
jgi:hypothetical protein